MKEQCAEPRLPRTGKVIAWLLALLAVLIIWNMVTPPQAMPGMASATATECLESEPCWDCETMGNLICGGDKDATEAWETWDKQAGWNLLQVDPSRPFRVDYMGSMTNVPENTDEYDLSLKGEDGRWYVFRAAYTDAP